MENKVLAPEFPPRLNAVLYFLYHISDVNDNSTYSRLAKYLPKTHSKEQIRQIKDAVDWGINNPQIDYAEILPGLRKSNEEILIFFTLLAEMLEKDPDLSHFFQP